MHRIDGPGALPGGQWTEGNPGSGVPATQVTAAWLQAVQEEIAGVVEGAGIALSKPSNAQLLAALTVLVNRAVPVGQVVTGYWNAAPAGFLLCNGALVSRSAYPALWAHAQAASLVVDDAAWGAGAQGLFSSGDGSTTFRLPDLRGEFPRFADMGRGVDAARQLGSRQADELRSHVHQLDTQGVSAGAVNVLEGGLHGGSGKISSGTTATGGAETRPRNVALAAAVRF
jgi:microcystin-dependent protein